MKFFDTRHLAFFLSVSFFLISNIATAQCDSFFDEQSVMVEPEMQGGDGSIDASFALNASMADEPFDFELHRAGDPMFFATNQNGNFFGLIGDTYTLSVSNPNGDTNNPCNFGPFEYIVEGIPCDPTFFDGTQADVTEETGAGFDGEIDASFGVFGTGPYTYILYGANPSPQSNTTGYFMGLAGGSYQMDVIDEGAGDCRSNLETITVGGPVCEQPFISAFVFQDNQNCVNPNGEIDISVSPGSYIPYDGYTIEVTSGQGQIYFDSPYDGSPITLTSLTGDNYVITVTDNYVANCTSTENITVLDNQDFPIISGVAISHETGSGLNDGVLDATGSVSGGSFNYTYEWYDDQPALYGSTEMISNLAPGTYSLIVKDSQTECVSSEEFFTINAFTETFSNTAGNYEGSSGSYTGSYDGSSGDAAAYQANLAAAIKNAIESSGEGVIDLSGLNITNGPLVLQLGLAPLTSGLQIIGPGPDLLTLIGSSPVMEQLAGNDDPLIVQNTTISGGSNSIGGGINFNPGSASPATLTVDNVVFENNFAEDPAGGLGGAIYYNSGGNGSVIINSTFQNNGARVDNMGDNSAGQGGAIFVATGDIDMSNNVFLANFAGTSGGAIAANTGSFTSVDSYFEGNESYGVAANEGGGAIYISTSGSNIIRNSTFYDNESGNEGGAVFCHNGDVELVHVTISRNTAGSGSGVSTQNSTINLNSSIIYGNTGGADFQSGGGPTNNYINNNIIGTKSGGGTSPASGLGVDPIFVDLVGDPIALALLNPAYIVGDQKMFIPSAAFAVNNGSVGLLATDQSGAPRGGAAATLGALEINVAPVLTVPVNLNGGTTGASYNSFGTVSFVDEDDDGDDFIYDFNITSTYSGTFGNSDGKFDVDEALPNTSLSGDDPNSNSISISGTLNEINAILATLAVQVDHDDPGPRTFNYSIDDNWTGYGGSLTDTPVTDPADFGNGAWIITDLDASDAGGPGTLRAAMVDAFSFGTGRDTFNFLTNNITGTIQLSADLPQPTNPTSITIFGSGADNLTIDANGHVFIDHNWPNRDVWISGITIEGGSNDYGGAIRMENGRGFNIYDVSIEGSTATNDGGAIYLSNLTGTTSEIENSYIGGNTATNGLGGGLYATGVTLDIIHSTIAGNSALGGAQDGGGMHLNNGTYFLSHITSAGNTSADAGDGLFVGGTVGDLALEYSILNDGTYIEAAATGATANGARSIVNLEGASELDFGLNTNVIYTTTDFSIGTAADNGGATKTILVSGTDAVNNALSSGATADQIGQTITGTPTLGALEVNADPTVTVPGTNPTTDDATAVNLGLSASDEDINEIKVTITATNSQAPDLTDVGVFSFNGATTGTTVSGAGTNSVTIFGGELSVNIALSALEYDPQGKAGVVTIDVTASDDPADGDLNNAAVVNEIGGDNTTTASYSIEVDGTYVLTEPVTSNQLIAAINSANATAGADVIDLTGITNPTILSGMPEITGSLTILGPGAELLTIQGASPALTITSGDYAASNMTFSGGMADGVGQNAGGIDFTGTGTLTLTQVRIEGNSESTNGIAGGIYYNSTSTTSSINRSLIYNNTGHGIYVADGNLSITNSTISNNGSGTGLVVDGSSGATSILSHVTITGNGINGIASTNGGFVRAEYIISYGNTSDDVTAVAGTDVDFGPSGAGTSFATDNIVGTSSPASFTDDDFVVTTDPSFDPLTTNGDHTDGYYPKDPAAVNASDTPTGATSTELVDQTGASRTGTNLTLGALEANAAPTASDFTLVAGVSRVINIPTSAFGYADGDGDAFTRVDFTSTPGAGTLWNDTNLDDIVDGGETVYIGGGFMAAIDLANGNLKYLAPSTIGPRGITFTVNDGTADSSPDNTATLRVVENALDFDGVNDYTSSLDALNYDFDQNDPFTLEAWVNPTGSGNYSVMAKYDGNVGYIFRINAGVLYFDLVNDGASNLQIAAFSTETVPSGAWSHVAVSYDGSGDISGVTFYLNGAELTRNTNQNALSGSTTNNSDFRVGVQDAGLTSPYTGLIDEVRVWNVARTPEEIRANASQLLTDPTSEINLVLYYDFNHGESDGINNDVLVTSVIDHSGNGNDGTPTNFDLDGTNGGGANVSNFTNSTAFVSSAATEGNIAVYYYNGTSSVRYPDLTVPVAFDYGTVAVGGTSDETFYIENEGLGQLTLDVDPAIDNTTDYNFPAGYTAPVVVNPGDSLGLGVQFNPQSGAVLAGTVTIASDDPDFTGPEYTFDVTGTGDAVLDIVDVEWRDSDVDGDIDQIQITFTGAVDFSDTNAGDAIPGLTVAGVGLANVNASLLNGQSVVVLDLAADIPGTGLPASPTYDVSYLDGGNMYIVSSADGSLVLSDGEVVADHLGTYTDGAIPLLDIASTVPVDGATGVATASAQITLAFTEQVNSSGTGNVTLYDAGDFVHDILTVGAGGPAASHLTSAYSALTAGSEYYAVIDDGLFDDGVFGYLAGSDNNELNFITAGSPTINDVTWLDSDLNGNIDQVQITFSSPMDFNDGNAGDGIPGLNVPLVGFANVDADLQNGQSIVVFDLGSEITGTAAPSSATYPVTYTAAVGNIVSSLDAGAELADGEVTANGGTYTDAAEPVVLSITPSSTIITDVTVALPQPAFSIEVVYSESLDGATNPIISFPTEDPLDAPADLVPNGQAFSNTNGSANDTFTQDYNVVDNDILLPDIDIDVDGAGAANGPDQSVTWGVSDAFSISTGASAPTIVAAYFIDSDTDGVIDEMVVELSEQVDETTADLDDFSLTGPGGSESIDAISLHTGSNVGNGRDMNDNDQYVTFEVSGITTGTAITDGSTPFAVAFIKDNDGNDMNSAISGLPADDEADVTEVDDAKPVPLSAFTRDNDRNGQIDRIVISFSEDITAGSIDTTPNAGAGGGGEDTTDEFEISGYDIASVLVSGSAEVTLTLAESGGPDTGATPVGTVAAGEIQDASAQLNTNDGGGGPVADGAPPVFISADAMETNNAYIDLTFSEGLYSVGGGPILSGDFEGFNLVGVASVGIDTLINIDNTSVLVGGESEIRFLISPSSDVTGGDTFQVRPKNRNGAGAYEGGDTDNPFDGNANEASTTLTLNTPAIVSFVSVLPSYDNSYVILEFSEAVDRDGDGGNPLRYRNNREVYTANFLQNTGNATAISIGNNDLRAPNNNTQNSGVEWRLNVSSVTGLPSNGDESFLIGPPDGSGNLGTNGGDIEIKASGSSRSVPKGTTFTVFLADQVANDFGNANAFAYDNDGDGVIDRVTVQFDDKIDDSTVDVSEFTFAGITPDAFNASTTSALDPGDPNDEFITFLITGYTGGTEVPPTATLVYSGTTLEDDAALTSYPDLTIRNPHVGNTFTNSPGATGISVSDEAAPVLVSIETEDLAGHPFPGATRNGKIDNIEVTFSEPVSGADAGDFTLGGGYTINAVTTVGNEVNLTLDEMASFDTNAQPSVTIANNGTPIEDAAGNDFAGASQNATDKVPPFAQIVNGAPDGNGYYVTYPINASSLNITINGTIDNLADNSAIVFVEVGGDGAVAIPSGGTWSVDLELPDVGTYDIEVTTFDSRGNAGPGDGTIDEIQLDGTNAVTINGFEATVGTANPICEDDDFVTLTPLVIAEQGAGNFAIQGEDPGTGDDTFFMLALPEDYFFNTAIPAGSGLSVTGTEISVTANYVGNTIIQLNFEVTGTAELNTLTLSGLQVGSTADGDGDGNIENITRFAGDANIFGASTNGQVFGNVEDYPTPPAIASVDVTSPSAISGVTEYATRINQGFQLNADPGNTINLPNDVEWYDPSLTPLFTGETPANTDLAAYVDVSTAGLYSVSVAEESNTCASDPLTVDFLVYFDDVQTDPGVATFEDQSFVVSDDPYVFYLSNPAVTPGGHDVSLASSGAGLSFVFQNDTIVATFDPAIAGAGSGSQDHFITYTVENTTTGRQMSIQRTFNVVEELSVFDGTPDLDLCVDDAPVVYDVDIVNLQGGTLADPAILFVRYLGEPHPYANISEAAITSDDTFTFDPSLMTVPDGGYTIIQVTRDVNGALDQREYINVYGRPLINLPNLSDSYCSDEDPVIIQRSGSYISSVNGPDDPPAFAGNTTTITAADITIGYKLYKEGAAGAAPVDAAYAAYGEVADFTSTAPIDQNAFYPSDPNQDGSFAVGEEGNYLVEYISEDFGTHACSGYGYKEITVYLQPSMPTLDATSESSGGSDVATYGFVNSDEYLLEYCVGDDLTGFTANVEYANLNYDENRMANINYTITVGGGFFVGETITGGASGAKAIIGSNTHPTNMTVTSLVGNFTPGETITGLSSSTQATVNTYVETTTTFTVGETITGLTSGATADIAFDLGGSLELINISGTFANGETIQGGTSGTTKTVSSYFPDISWYDQDQDLLAAFDNNATITSAGAGLNVSSNKLLAPEIKEFYFSTTSPDGCESELRRVEVNVYANPDIPEITIPSPFVSGSVKSGNVYRFDYCGPNGGVAMPDNIVVDDTSDPFISDGSQEFEVVRGYYNGLTFIIQATYRVASPTINISAFRPGQGEYYRYQISKVSNINFDDDGDGQMDGDDSDFEGCQGGSAFVFTFGWEEPTNPTAADMSAGTLDFHRKEGAALVNINHSTTEGMDTYQWYENNNKTNQIGGSINAGAGIAESTLTGFSTTPDSSHVNDSYTYYMTRTDNAVASRDFSGCESAGTTPVNITVHASQTNPFILSDNSKTSLDNFTDLNYDADGTNDDGTVEHYFSLCTDQVDDALGADDSQFDIRVEAYLNYTNLANSFQVGETVTGGASGATGVVTDDSGEMLTLDNTSGSFTFGEQITGDMSAGTADVVNYRDYDATNLVLTISAVTGTFSIGQTITGGNSDATALISTVGAGTLNVTVISGVFSEEETITSATANAQIDNIAGQKREYIWYSYNFGSATRGTRLFTGADADFNSLSLSGIGSATTRYFEVVQLTDIDQFEGVESASSLIRVVISDQDDLSFRNAGNTVTYTNGAEYCTDDGNAMGEQDLFLYFDDGGGAMQASLSDISYYVTSGIKGGAQSDIIGSSMSPELNMNPTIDFQAWHQLAGGSAPNMAGDIVGGPATSHLVTMFYTDPTTNCIGQTSLSFNINPLPDISFTVNGVDINDVNFATSFDEFCYDDANFTFEGTFSDGSPLTRLVGSTFSSSVSGISTMTTNNNKATFDPSNEHDEAYGGGASEYENQSTHVITFTYVDEFGCQNSVDATIYVNPIPEALGVAGTSEIRFNEICQGQDASAFIRMTTDGTNEVGSYAGYSFTWVVNGTDYGTVAGSNQSPAIAENTTNLNFSVTVSDPSGCGEVFTETHQKQPLPTLNITGINNLDPFCTTEDGSEPALALTDAGAATNATNIQSWVVRSYATNDIDTVTYVDPLWEDVQVASGSGTMPQIDISGWHENATLGGTTIGGNSTVHSIFITYQDPNRTYQGSATLCENTVVETIIINPQPEIDFEVNGLADAYGSFGGDAGYTENFCYENGSVSLIGILRDGSGNPINLPAGTGSFSGPGVIPTGNSIATWNPQTANGNDPHALDADGVDITFTFTDGNGCQNTVVRTLFVDPTPDPVEFGPDNDQIQFAEICADSPIEAFVQIYQPGTTNIITDYTDYEFDWIIGSLVGGTLVEGSTPTTKNRVTFQSSITNASSNHDFNISVIVTRADDTGNGQECFIEIEEEHEIQELPDLSFNVISDGQPFCQEDADVQFTMTTDAGVIGVAAATDIDNLDYSVYSYRNDLGFGSGSVIESGSGINPTINMDQWHLDAGGTLLGGEYTVHEITMTYEDLTDNQYQGVNTECINSVTSKVFIYPDPDLSFTVDGVDRSDAGFVGNVSAGDMSPDDFCYGDASVNLAGIFGPLTASLGYNIALGTGSFSSTTPGAVSPTGNNTALFNPTAAHNAFHGGGVNPHAARSIHDVTFTFTDQFTCENSVTAKLYVNPLPDPIEVVGGTEDGDQIKFSAICVESPITAYVDIVNPANYTYNWTLPGVASGATYSVNEVTYNSSIPNNQGNKQFTISVEVVDIATGCSFTITETHIEQSLPTLDFTVIDDGDQFCAEDLDLPLFLSTNSGIIDQDVAGGGSNDDNDIDDLSYQVTSYLASDLVTPTNTFSGTGNPTIDFDRWHLDAGGNATLSPDGHPMGGENTVHVITMTYQDNRDNEYQNVNTSCINTTSATITIYPDPDVTFTMTNDGTAYDIQRDPGAFAGDEPASTDVSSNAGVANHFCYDDASIPLAGIFGPLTDGMGYRLELGTGQFSGTGVVITGNNQATFNPAAAHDATYPASLEPEFEPRSSHTIRFTYTDEFGCVNFIEQDVYVNPLPEPEDDAVKGFIQFEALCQGFPKTAEVVLLDVNTGLEVADYSQYTFDWDLAPSSSNPTFVDNSVTFDDNNLIFTIGVTVTHNNTGCAIFKSESETQGFPPIPTFTYVGISADDNDPNNLVDGLDIYIHEDNPSLNVEDGDQGVDYLEFNLYDASNTLVYSLVVDDEIDGVGAASAFIYDDDQPVPTSADTPSVTITGLAAGEYTSELIMGSLKGCLIPDATRTITILPVISDLDPESMTNSTYSENFNNGKAGWYVEIVSEDGKSDNRVSSWEVPNSASVYTPEITTELDGAQQTVDISEFLTIKTDADGNDPTDPTPSERGSMFITDWDNSYLENEISYVYSPAFDLSRYGNPALSFDHWRDFDSGRDGLVIQVSDDDGRNWVELGDNDLSSGVNWFTNQGISAGPGESARYPEIAENEISVGFADFTRKQTDPNEDSIYWAESRHIINEGAPRQNLIRFRFALASGGGEKFTTGQESGVGEVITNVSDGFAFDNFTIYEKNKLVLVEQFSSTFSDLSKQNEFYIANGNIENGTSGMPQLPRDHTPIWDSTGVIINYFTDFYNDEVNNRIDPLNARNKVDPSTRATVYGISDAPATRVSGLFVPYDIETNREDFGNGLDAISLAAPEFLIPDFGVDISDADVISGSVEFHSNIPIEAAREEVELLFFVAVVEKRIPALSSLEMNGIDDPQSVYTNDTDTIHHVLRKLLPSPGGDYYKGPLTDEFVHTLDFKWTISGIYNEDEIRLIAFVQYYNDDLKGNSIEQANFVDVSGKTNVEVGIEEQLAKHGYEIYPNPSDDVLNLELKDIPNEDVYYRISDQAGREVIRGVVHRGSKSSVPIDTSDLPSGLYILQLHSEERNYRPRKVIVNH